MNTVPHPSQKFLSPICVILCLESSYMSIRIFGILRLTLGIAAIATVCSAAGSVASVTSAQPFSLDGVNLVNPGVTTWPVVSNDEISTAAGAAMLTFRDGSAIKIAPQSRIRLSGSPTSPEVILIAGNVDTKLASGSNLIVTKASPDDKDGTPDYNSVATTAARSNNNTNFRKKALLYSLSALALAGLALGADAILQPAGISPTH
jgi:hypothetical protein